MTTLTERPAGRPLIIMTCFLGVTTALAVISTVAAARLHSKLDRATCRLENTQVELETVRKELETATRRTEISTGQVARLIQLKTSLEKDIGDIRVAYNHARKGLKQDELRIAVGEDEGCRFGLVSGPPVPAIDARVAAVKSNVTPELVLLSVGSDDKVEKGFHFSIYRGTEFVGKVVVEKVLRDSCGCRVLFTSEGARILAGDSAATRLQ